MRPTRLLSIFALACIGCATTPPLPPDLTVDHADPPHYLAAGAATGISDDSWSAIQAHCGGSTLEEVVSRLYSWKRRDFRSVAGGGRLVGRNDAERILSSRELTGCHDHGLLVAAVLRRRGFPVVFVDAAGIGWAQRFRRWETRGFSGHVFLEVFDRDRWKLLNSTEPELVEDYDPGNRLIPLKTPGESVGYFALCKGIDPPDYGVRSIADLTARMAAFAEWAAGKKLEPPRYGVRTLP